MKNSLLKQLIFAVFTSALFASCSYKQKTSAENFRGSYAGLINLNNSPAGIRDLESNAFFDLGAWFGFALPDDKDPHSLVSFSGPLLLTSGKWLGKYILKLELFENQLNINFQNSRKNIEYLPGILKQRYTNANSIVELSLIFISPNKALIKQKIKNISDSDNEYSIVWKGSLFKSKNIKIRANANSIEIWKDGDSVLIGYPQAFGLHPEISEDSFSMTTNSFMIKAGAEKVNFIRVEFLSKYELRRESSSEINYEDEFLKNNLRWKRYITSAAEGIKTDNRKKIAVKALITLMNNYRSPIGGLKFGGLFPSYSARYFNGFRAWDSWNLAAALSEFDCETAENQIRAMMYEQSENGMIPDVVYADSSENNWRNGKPPLAAWAVWKIFLKSGDEDFLKEMIPRLINYHRRQYFERDRNHNGLCELGSSDGGKIAALREGGTDDAVRFDNSLILKNSETAFPLNRESVGLNSFLYLDKIYISKILHELGREEESEKFAREAENLKIKIQKYFFDANENWFFDRNINGGKFVSVKGSEGFIPLFTGAASQREAEQIKNIILDSTKFNTFVPLPTLSADEPNFMSGYRRGPVWLDQAYFAIAGLRKYGFAEEAEMLTRKILLRCEGLSGKNFTIRENYNPRTGKGMYARNFSLSAASLLMLLKSSNN